MKLLLVFLPLLLYVATLRIAELQLTSGVMFSNPPLLEMLPGAVDMGVMAPAFLATGIALVGGLSLIVVLKLLRRPVGAGLWCVLSGVLVLGGMTVLLEGTSYAKWKPSVIVWAVGVVLWLGPALLGRNFVQFAVGRQLALSPRLWHRLNFAWICFLAWLGLLNLWVAHAYHRDVWLLFAQLGAPGLVAAFVAAQAVILGRYRVKDGSPDHSRRAAQR